MKGIALRLWIGMMSLVVLILIFLWLFQIVFLDSFYKDMRISEIQKQGLEIIKELGEDDFVEFKDKIDAFAYNNNLTVDLLDLDYHILYTTGVTGGQMGMMIRNSIKTEAFNEALEGKIVKLSMNHSRFNSEYILMTLPVKVAETIEGALSITIPLAPVEETADILKKQFLYITIILLGAAVILSYLLSKSFTKPILEITKVSREMAKGNFSARIEINRKDEIGSLAKTINYMGQELQKVDQLRKEFIANVSHELRTPLSLIKGYAETIRDVSGNNLQKREKQISIIIEESDRLTKVVEDILNLSQIEAGYMTLDMTEFSLNTLLLQVEKRYEILGEKTGIGMNFSLAEDVFVKADKSRMEQVLYNLISNAFNHSSEGGIVTLKTFEDLSSIKIEISDTGEGISDEEISYIWDRFYKGDKSGKRRTAGTGLGLSIVKSILTAHGLDYGVKSKVGEGSTFWFEINKVAGVRTQV